MGSRGSDTAVFVIRLYQLLLSPIARSLGFNCRFYPTCSEYGKEAFAQHGLLKGFCLTAWRILRCNPFGGGSA